MVARASVTLPGAGEGIRWLLSFDASSITPTVAIAALGQVVFSIGLGGTLMLVYGSYLGADANIRSDAIWTVVGDTGAGLLAGLAIFPAVFAFGMEPGSGPGLLFATLPQIFAQLPVGWVFGALFFGGLSQALLRFAELGIPTWFPFVFFGAVFAFALPFLNYRVNQKTYERTEYSFYPDKLDYHEGFFTVDEKTIALHRVTAVNLRTGIFQSKHGLGTILLSTPVTSAGRGHASAGIRIHDVAHPDENYKRIKELVERSQLPQQGLAA